MRQIRLTQEANIIVDIVNKLQCVHVSQLDYFLPPPKPGCSNEGKGLVVASFLARNKVLAKDGDIIFPYHIQKYSQETIDSIWLMINILNSQGDSVPLYQKLTTCMQAEYPANTCFIMDNTFVIKTLPVLTETAIPLINFEQERFYTNTKIKVGEEEKAKMQYILVIRSEEMLNQIGQLNLTFNHKIALLEGELNTMPKIRFFSAEATK